MKSNQYVFKDNQWTPRIEPNVNAQWVLVFGDRGLAVRDDIRTLLAVNFPNAQRMGCSTSGEIAGDTLYDKSLVVSVIQFQHTELRAEHLDQHTQKIDSDFAFGQALASKLATENLKYAFVLSNGHALNGTSFVDGIRDGLPAEVLLTGGLAGDDDRFLETMVWHNDHAKPTLAVICGLYGNHINIGHGSLGGWDPFGPNRTITRSKDNVLYELDGENALNLYKTYLGEHAKELPASALLFPLEVATNGGSAVVRTILAIDEQEQSMTFAGDMPQGGEARLMRANFDRLIDGANQAAEQSLVSLQEQSPSFALLISCVGRRLVLKQRVEEELEQVMDVVGDQCVATGFYSYGEISPFNDTFDCQLHNQTMTITTFSEH